MELLKFVLVSVLASGVFGHHDGFVDDRVIQIHGAVPTIKCAEIISEVSIPGPENHHGCLSHCATLNKEYKHGKCLKGICHCQLEQNIRRGKPTIQCDRIVPIGGTASPHNHKACKTHCHNVAPEFIDGECIEGVCHCQEHQIIKEVIVPHCQTHDTCSIYCKGQGTCHDGVCRCDQVAHPAIRCEHLVPLNGHTSPENHELCLAHCHTLGAEYEHGECLQGVCHCQRLRRNEIVWEHPTVKCEYIHPIRGLAGPENHEACSVHCRDIADHYLEGKCVEGMCKCKMGVVVTPVVKDVVDVKEVVRCEDLKPVLGKDHHEACLNHCIGLKDTYKTGLCAEGICHCH